MSAYAISAYLSCLFKVDLMVKTTQDIS